MSVNFSAALCYISQNTAYTGAPGGTKETIDYAEKKGLEVREMPRIL